MDSWQQQCCGKDFGLGSTVEWNVEDHEDGSAWATQLLGDEWGHRVKYREEHNGPEKPDLTLCKVVRSIRVVLCDRVLGTVEGRGPGQAMIPVPGSGRLREVAFADPWEPEPRSKDHSTTFDGWIVELEIDESARR